MAHDVLCVQQRLACLAGPCFACDAPRSKSCSIPSLAAWVKMATFIVVCQIGALPKRVITCPGMHFSDSAPLSFKRLIA
jgi:hypothetical protein